MGMYTELIFGATLKKETPKEVIDTLRYMICENENIKKISFEYNRNPLFMGSYSFAVNNPVAKMWIDDIDDKWHISTRSNCKNYDNDIENFLEWIKPYIESGSGANDMYAIVIHEDQIEPTIYYLDHA